MDQGVPKVKVILNPYAGRWKAGKATDKVQTALASAGIKFELERTERPGHAIELARAAAEAGFRVIVAAGGDGTISEVVNGLAQAVSDGIVGQLGIVPLGSANDLAIQLELPLDIEGACQCIARGRTKRLDLGRVNDRFFDNDVTIAFGAQVNIEAARLTWLRGPLIYLTGVLLALWHYRTPEITVTWDGGQITQRITLAYVGNGYLTGGMFRITPEARHDDGWLDFAMGGAMGRLKILTFLPQVVRGTHMGRPEVTYFRCTRLSITSDDPLPVLADGEIIYTDAHQLEISLQPARLEVIV
ncbi:MAG TPA: diacylglycerol kinase family lipid kinase [Anaerolineae bacterium]|nr:diacylglycerol kinase family lipid kinase [Anaerolineae bacterium]